MKDTSERIEMSDADFDLAKAIDNAVSAVKPLINTRYQELKLNTDGIIHKGVAGDRQKVQQIIEDLLTNSARYTPAGGLVTFTAAEKSSDKEGMACFQFVFEDNGLGISKEFMESLSESSEPEEKGAISRTCGSGTVLSAAFNYVRAMDGTIEVENRHGEGTRFTAAIFLKLQKREELPEKAPAEEANTQDMPVDRVDISDKYILVAEGFEANWEIVRMLLPDYGFVVERAQDGQACVDMFKASKAGYYDGILMDLRLPVKDGFEAAAEIRGSGRPDARIPIIAMAADVSAGDVQACMEAGMDGHIARPIDFAALVKLLNQFLR